MQKVLDDSDWSAKAWMSKPDANLFDALLHIKSARTAGRLDVLEWGAGRSTSYFTRALHALRGDNFCWHSIEYDRGYFEGEIRASLDALPTSTVGLVESGADLQAMSPGTTPVEFAVYDHGTLKPMLDEGVDDLLRIPFTHRAVDHSRLAEPATPGAAPEHLDVEAVVNHLGERHQLCLGVGPLRQVGDGAREPSLLTMVLTTLSVGAISSLVMVQVLL